MSEQKTISKLFENKFVVHIVCEMVAFLGLIFYISGKNKKLVAHIEQLNQRLEAQDTLIQKLDGFCQQLSPLIGKLNERVYALENSPLMYAREFPEEKTEKKVPSSQVQSGRLAGQQTKASKPQTKPVSKAVEAPSSRSSLYPGRTSNPLPLATIEEILNEKEESEEQNKVTESPENNESSETAEESDGELDKDLSEELEELNESTSLKKTP